MNNNGSDRSETTANAVIRADGQIEIISGGAACYKCGKPTMTRELADPFGKSDMMRWVCNDCTQYPDLRRLGNAG